MGILECQAHRALERALLPDEEVRGFTPCEWNNGKATVLAFSGRAVSRGFLAFSDMRVFVIPERVRDLMTQPLSQVDDIYTRGLDEFLTLKLDARLSVDLIVADPAVSTALLELWADYFRYAGELFDLEFRTPDFDQRMLEEMDTQLARGLPFDDAVRQVGIGVHQLVLQSSQNKSMAYAGASAALRIARSHPACVGAGTAEPGG